MSMDRITVTLLGKVAVERDGRPVPGLTGVLARAVLTVLVVSGRPVARPELCALFWPEAPETQARQNARRVLARLRRALPGRITADRHAVAFVAAVGDVIVPAVPGARPRNPADSRRAGDTAAAAGGAELAADLDSAAGAAFDAWLAARRAERRAAAAGSPTAIADAPLEGLADRVRLAPLDEAPARALMRALGRAGRFDEALAAYDDLSRRLGTALGVGPSAAATDLRDRVAAAALRPRRINLPPPADRDRTDGDAGASDAPAQLAAWIADPARRLVTLVDPDAVRRQAWARAAAARTASRWLDGIAWVAGGSGAGASLAERVARAVRAVDGVDVPPADVGRWLAPLERLVVLDDCDAVAGDAATAASLADWLEAAPDLTVLALASRPLGLVFEHRFVGTPS